MHMALGKRKGMIMDIPDKEQPQKHFFQIPANYFELSEEEQSAFHAHIAGILHGESQGQSLSPDEGNPERL